MFDMENYKIALIMSALLAAASAMPNGAPESACGSMEPSTGARAHGPDIQSSNTFFNNYGAFCRQTAAGQVTVTIQGGFRGILVQVRNGNTAVGTFQRPSDSNFKRSCSNRAITHTDRNDKEQGEFVVDVGNANIANLQCVMTVVQEKTMYWVKQSLPVTALAGAAPVAVAPVVPVVPTRTGIDTSSNTGTGTGTIAGVGTGGNRGAGRRRNGGGQKANNRQRNKAGNGKTNRQRKTNKNNAGKKNGKGGAGKKKGGGGGRNRRNRGGN